MSKISKSIVTAAVMGVATLASSMAMAQKKHGYDFNVTSPGGGAAVINAGTTHQVSKNTQVYTNLQTVIAPAAPPQITSGSIGIRGTF